MRHHRVIEGVKDEHCNDAFISIASGTNFLNYYPVPRPEKSRLCPGIRQADTTRNCNSYMQVERDITRGHHKGISPWCFDIPPSTITLKCQCSPTNSPTSALNWYVLTRSISASARSMPEPVLMSGTSSAPSASCSSRRGSRPSSSTMPTGRDARRGEQHAPLEITDIAFSGVEQWARQFILLSRREKYTMDGNHKLFFKYGGSAGHGGLYDLDIYEGVIDDDFRGRVWDVTLVKAAEAMEKTGREGREATRIRATQNAVGRERCPRRIDAIISGGKVATKTACVTRRGSTKSEWRPPWNCSPRGDYRPVRASVEIGSNARRAVKGFIRTPPPVETPALNFGEVSDSNHPDHQSKVTF